MDIEVNPKYVKWGVILNAITLMANLSTNAFRALSIGGGRLRSVG